MSPSQPTNDPPPKVLYFLTSTMSSRFLKGQLAFLIDRGFQVHVAAGCDTSETGVDFDNLVSFHPAPFVRTPQPWQDFRSLRFALRLTRQIRPDIVNASTPKAGLIGIVAAFLCRTPGRVYVVRGFRYETAMGLSHRALRVIERLVIRLSTQTVFNSVSLRALAESDGLIQPGKGFVLAGGSGNGIDTRRFRDIPSKADARRALGIPLDVPTIGFVGRLAVDKGINDLVEAFLQIRSIGTDAHLVVAGPMEGASELSAQTRRAIEYGETVTWLGASQDVGVVLAAIDVLAFPSYREGLPNAPLEAQLCGVPVVAYAATGTIDALVAPSTRLAVPVGDVEQLAVVLTTALTDCDIRDECQRDAPDEIARRFDQKAVWSELLQIYFLTLAACDDKSST